MKMRTLLLASAAALVASPVAADEIKIGFVTTLSGGPSIIGQDMQNSVELAREHMGNKMGPLDVNVIYADDKGPGDPSVGRQATQELVQRDEVDIVAGYIWSNVLLASQKVALDAGKFLISSNAGPSQMAGELCHENFFSTSWQNDQTPMALGEALNERGVKSVYLMAPNYAAGKDMVSGVERTFDGEIKGRDMTKWPDQIDFSSELAKAKASGAEAIWFFYPGKHTGAFIKQFAQAGLEGEMQMYSVFSLDELSLPRFQDAGTETVLGSITTGWWAPFWEDGLAVDNELNKKFVSDYKAKHGTYPSYYGAQSYDTMSLIKHAVEAVDGDIDDMDGMREAMASADFPSLGGDWEYAKDHFPNKNFYELQITENANGEWVTKATKVVLENHQNSYVDNCSM